MTTESELAIIEAQFSEGNREGALELAQKLLEREPDNVRAINDLGAICQGLGRFAEAEAAFRRALELEPGRHDTRGNLALALCVQEKWAEAEGELKTLLAANQNDGRLWALMARVERAQGHYATAVEYLDRCLVLDPGQKDLRETRDHLAKLAGRAQPAAPAKAKPYVLMCCQKGLDHFANQLCDELEKTAVVRRAVGRNMGELHWPIRSAPTVWLEWGSDLAAEATRHPDLLSGKRVIVRLHSFEILNGQAGRLDYGRVDDVVFVCRYMRELFGRKFPGLLSHARVHTIHNGVDLARFPFTGAKGRGGNVIAFVGRLDFKKDPMVMLQAFKFLRNRHPELRLAVAGRPDDNRYYLAMPDFLEKNGLKGCADFAGQVDDMPQWYEGKDYILCTSPIESQGVGLLEAMHSGLRPLIYNFPGAGNLYPREFLWDDFDGLEKLLEHGPAPEAGRDFVAAHYSMARQAASFMRLLTTEEEVTEPDPAGEGA